MNHTKSSTSRKVIYLPHMSLKELAMMPIWQDVSGYRVISSVRNPWDRAVSGFYWDQRKRERPKLSDVGSGLFVHKTGGWLKSLAGLYSISFDKYVFLKTKSIAEGLRIGTEDPKIDFWIRFESLEEDLSKLSEWLNTPIDLGESIRTIKTKTTTRPKHWPGSSSQLKHLFNSHENTLDHVAKVCEYEIKKFQYKFE